MNWLIILSISKKHLLARLKQSVTAALGVTFGIGAFITLVSFMTGLNHLLDGLILDRTPHIHVYSELKPSEIQPIERVAAYANSLNIVNSVKPKSKLMKIHNAVPMLQYFRNDPRVKGVTPLLTTQVFYNAGTIRLNGIINGIDPVEDNRLFHIGDYIIEGSPEDLARDLNGILLGAGLAKKLSLKVGDRVGVTTADADQFQLKIVGIYQSGLAEIDNMQSYTNLKTAQIIGGKDDSYITDLNIKLYDIEHAAPMTAEILNQFDVSAIDINTANAQFEIGTRIRNSITYSVSITLLVVAGFGIYNILNMMIYEKMNDIAILKAIGFSGRDVKMIFITQAVLIGLIGGVFGLVIGFMVSVAIDHTPFVADALPTIRTFPVIFNPLYYIIGIVFAMLSTFIAGYLPAKRAQNIDPVIIIRRQ